jgi:DNA processing protein
MTAEERARLMLLACIEGGSIFWSTEIATHGAIAMVDRIKGGFYSGKKESANLISALMKTLNEDYLEEELDRYQCQLLIPTSDLWPLMLNDLAAPPFALIYQGDISLASERSIAIVGTRNPTSYGSRTSSELAANLSDRDWGVVSGGAYGIDTAAHRGSLAAEGRTISVLGSGIVAGYPAGNQKLFAEIADAGVLISEVMPLVKAMPYRFLARNRIIAALTHGTVVVEAAYRSGSLRTANVANQLHRRVMAVPGQISMPTSDGCHRLIIDREAELITSVGDIMELVETPLNATIGI